MEPIGTDDRFEHAIRHPKVFLADAREGRSRRFVSVTLFLMGALFVMAFGVWFASIRETAAESSAQAAAVRSHIEAPATASTVYLAARRANLLAARAAIDSSHGRIFKCVGKSGAATFQQFPCPADSRTDKVIAYVPRYELVQSPPTYSAPVQVTQYETQVAASKYVDPYGECKAAQNFADERRKQMGIHATVEGLRYLHDYVYEHCKNH